MQSHSKMNRNRCCFKNIITKWAEISAIIAVIFTFFGIRQQNFISCVNDFSGLPHSMKSKVRPIQADLIQWYIGAKSTKVYETFNTLDNYISDVEKVKINFYKNNCDSSADYNVVQSYWKNLVSVEVALKEDRKSDFDLEKYETVSNNFFNLSPFYKSCCLTLTQEINIWISRALNGIFSGCDC